MNTEDTCFLLVYFNKCRLGMFLVGFFKGRGEQKGACTMTNM